MKYSTTHKRVINYSTGGLGNRLRPLSSAYAVHKETGKILCQYWDSKTTNGTLAKFNELFENDIKELSSKDLENLESYKIYSEINNINRLSSKYGRHDLIDMVGKSPESLAPRGSYISDNSEDNIIFYCNNFIPNTNRDFCHEFIRSLRPIPIIQEKIDKETVELGLNKNVIGVHARGTDFNVDVGYYINQMRDYGSSVTFFLSTDDVKYEKEICSIFKERVITRQGRAHLTKENEEGAWEYNFVISKEKSQDSIVDMYLLAKTDIQIYHPASTFSEIAKVLS
tara:strand:- start:3874 stop:4722 length:849 start_codon:yes stop_codon:yes gene_type:complete